MSEEFVPFPQERVRQIEAAAQAKKPYQSPHLPKPRVSGANMMQEPTVAVQSPGFVAPTSEPEGVSLELPSRFAFYSFKDLYVKPFKGLHLAKLSRAKEEQSTIHMVEAVSSVLSTSSGESHLGFKLTLNDFYFVLYWLRINSFTKSAFTHTSTCVNEDHIAKVNSGELGVDTLTQTSIVNKSNIQTVMLDTAPNLNNYILEYPNIVLRPVVMQDVIEMTEDPEFSNEEFRFSAQVAAYITGGTLRQRIDLVNDMSPDDIETIKSYEKSIAEYGIVEKIQVVCKGCGATRMETIQLDAHSFFP